MGINYDKDGFFILRRTNKQPSLSVDDNDKILGKVASPMIDVRVGENFLYYPHTDVTPTSAVGRSTQFRIYSTTYKTESGKKKLITAFGRKAWQNKAWDIIGRTIQWDNKFSEFKNCTTSRKIRHIKRVGLMCRVRAEMDSGKRKVNIDQLEDINSPTYPYMIIDNPRTLKIALDIIRRMMYVNIDQYLKRCNKEKLEVVTISCKALIVYDDYTFDTVIGNPQRLFDLLEIEVDKKGRIVL